jgi:hypothetical protein
MTTKLRFEVQGKSPLVYLTFYNDDFEKNLAKENADDFDRIDFHLANEVMSFIPGEGLELGPDSVKVYKNNELIYEDFEWVTMGYDTGGLASKVSFGIDTSLIGVKYKNTFYKFDCTNEGGFNEFEYYKKVDGQWESAEEIEEKINEMV